MKSWITTTISTNMFIRFVLVGCVNTAFSYLIYATLVLVGLHFALANFLSLIAGIFLSFKLQGALVFGVNSSHLFVRFVLFWSIFYLVNVTFIAYLVTLGLTTLQAGAITTPPMALISFFFYRRLVFVEKK